MKKHYITFEKLSKKARQEINNSKRGSWNGLNPVTKVVKSKKLYNRQAFKNVDNWR